MERKDSFSLNCDELSRQSSFDSDKLFESGDLSDLLEDFEKKRVTEIPGLHGKEKKRKEETRNSSENNVYEDVHPVVKLQHNSESFSKEIKGAKTKEIITEQIRDGERKETDNKDEKITQKEVGNGEDIILSEEETGNEEKCNSSDESEADISVSKSKEESYINDISKRLEDNHFDKQYMMDQDKMSRLLENDKNQERDEKTSQNVAEVVSEAPDNKGTNNVQTKDLVSPSNAENLLNEAGDLHKKKSIKQELGFSSDSSLDLDVDASDDDDVIDETMETTSKKKRPLGNTLEVCSSWDENTSVSTKEPNRSANDSYVEVTARENGNEKKINFTLGNMEAIRHESRDTRSYSNIISASQTDCDDAGEEIVRKTNNNSIIQSNSIIDDNAVDDADQSINQNFDNNGGLQDVDHCNKISIGHERSHESDPETNSTERKDDDDDDKLDDVHDDPRDRKMPCSNYEEQTSCTNSNEQSDGENEVDILENDEDYGSNNQGNQETSLIALTREHDSCARKVNHDDNISTQDDNASTQGDNGSTHDDNIYIQDELVSSQDNNVSKQDNNASSQDDNVSTQNNVSSQDGLQAAYQASDVEDLVEEEDINCSNVVEVQRKNDCSYDYDWDEDVCEGHEDEVTNEFNEDNNNADNNTASEDDHVDPNDDEIDTNDDSYAVNDENHALNNNDGRQTAADDSGCVDDHLSIDFVEDNRNHIEDDIEENDGNNIDVNIEDDINRGTEGSASDISIANGTSNENNVDTFVGQDSSEAVIQAQNASHNIVVANNQDVVECDSSNSRNVNVGNFIIEKRSYDYKDEHPYHISSESENDEDIEEEEDRNNVVIENEGTQNEIIETQGRNTNSHQMGNKDQNDVKDRTDSCPTVERDRTVEFKDNVDLPFSESADTLRKNNSVYSAQTSLRIDFDKNPLPINSLSKCNFQNRRRKSFETTRHVKGGERKVKSVPCSSRENTDIDEKPDVQEVKDSVNLLLKRLLQKTKEKESEKEENSGTENKSFMESKNEELELSRTKRGPVPLPRKKIISDCLEIEESTTIETKNNYREANKHCEALNDFLVNDTDFQPISCSTPISPRSPRKGDLVSDRGTLSPLPAGAEINDEKETEIEPTGERHCKTKEENQNAHAHNCKDFKSRYVIKDEATSGLSTEASQHNTKQTFRTEKNEEESIYATSDDEFIGMLSRYRKYRTASEHHTRNPRKDHDEARKRDELHNQRSKAKMLDLQNMLSQRNARKPKSILVDAINERNKSRYSSKAQLTLHETEEKETDKQHRDGKSSCYYRELKKKETLDKVDNDRISAGSPSSDKSCQIYSGNFDQDGYEVPVDNFTHRSAPDSSNAKPSRAKSETDVSYHNDERLSLVKDQSNVFTNGGPHTIKPYLYACTDEYQSNTETMGYLSTSEPIYDVYSLETEEFGTYSNKDVPLLDSDLDQGTIKDIRFPISHRGPGIILEDGPELIVKDVKIGSDAHRDSRLEPGDRLLVMNNYSLTNASRSNVKLFLKKLYENPSERYLILKILRHDIDEFDDDSTIDKSMSLPSCSHDLAVPTLIHGNYATQAWDEPLRLPSKLELNYWTVDENKSILASNIKPLSPSAAHLHVRNSNFLQDHRACSVNRVSTDYHNSQQGCHHDDHLLMIPPGSKVHLSKLESALSYLGLDLSEIQKCTLRSQVHIDSQGYVVYQEFLQRAKFIYDKALEDNGRAASKALSSPLPDIVPNTRIHNGLTLKMEEMLNEKDRIKDEIVTIKSSINKRTRKLKTVEQELAEVKEDLEKVRQRRSILLKKNAQLGYAKTQASAKVNTYKYEIESLEKELHRLKASNVPVTSRAVTKCAAVEKQIQDLVHRLRSIERSNRNFHQVTQKLMEFAYKVQRVSGTKRVNWHNSGSSSDHTYQAVAEARSASNPPKAKKEQLLSSEARKVITAVESLLNDEQLPYGWEEAYTKKGEKYFMNHVTGSTTWAHPLKTRDSTRPRRGQLDGRNSFNLL